VPEPQTTAIDTLVQANHVLARQQIVDAFGHASVRDPSDPSRFLISRSMAPALVAAADIMSCDLCGAPHADDPRKPFLERFIHAAIYRARPDVGAVVHSHSHGVIPFGIVPTAPLRPAFHMAGFLAKPPPVFEIRDTAGEGSDMLIRTLSLGEQLARSLGDATVVLMRGHGSTAVGKDLPEVVFRAIYLEANARIQSEAMRLGTPVYLNQLEAERAAAANAGQVNRAWELWCREVAG
jgi:ribulose-5-phosphate 4-epimerase/fuculose-1-phosphate aldolase